VPYKVFKRTAAYITETLSHIERDVAASFTTHTIKISC